MSPASLQRETLLAVLPPLTRRDRIRAKILARCVIDEDGCLLWQGPDSGKQETGRERRGGGYPRMNLDGGTVAVHIAWFVNENGIIPPGKELDHNCKKRRCISCSELVTHKENCRRRDASNGVVRRKRKRARRKT